MKTEKTCNQFRIDKGDRVQVAVAVGAVVEGVVEYIPGAPGDSWVIVLDDGGVIYIQQFLTMGLLSKQQGDER